MGYDLYDVSQAQFTLIKFFDQVMGAIADCPLINGSGATYVHSLPGTDEARSWFDQEHMVWRPVP